MKVTKHRSAGGWAVHLDGSATGLFITKGQGPRWGMTQDWDVMRGEGPEAEWLFEARSASGAMSVLAALFAIGRGATT